eukprot:CAMPEP_0115483646 /NCGR_PEP_ID=MMETSP0271-20121206/58963_1 /TAXON_ID=71861 /ORGANISM="Scrippsiella trochoidea, Strain CCMP3099" /LENGTH=473 /DNA_ID=CAMNT_0002911503 /DNA_START=43 /DNA_END=1460 /DNA_ORIENTATION=+
MPIFGKSSSTLNAGLQQPTPRKTQVKARLAEAEKECASRTHNLSQVQSNLDGAKEDLSQSKFHREQTKDRLVQTYSTVSSMRSMGAVLVFDLKRARDERGVAEEELKACELEAASEQAAVASVRERIRWLSQMQAALHTARVEATPVDSKDAGPSSSSPTSLTHVAELAKAANEQEDANCVALQPALGAHIAEAAAVELECDMWSTESQKNREASAELHLKQQVLISRQEEKAATVRRAQADVEVLLAKVRATREQVEAAEKEYERLKVEHARMEANISSQQAGMVVLANTYKSQVSPLLPTFAEMRLKKQQADLLYTQRMEEIQRARSASIDAGASARAGGQRSVPSSARGARPATTAGVISPQIERALPSGVAVQTSRPVSVSAACADLDGAVPASAPAHVLRRFLVEDARPASANVPTVTGLPASGDSRPPSARSMCCPPMHTGRGAAPAPSLDLRPPELRLEQHQQLRG